MMALTRAFKETVQARVRKDRKYREELLREGGGVSPLRKATRAFDEEMVVDSRGH